MAASGGLARVCKQTTGLCKDFSRYCQCKHITFRKYHQIKSLFQTLNQQHGQQTKQILSFEKAFPLKRPCQFKYYSNSSIEGPNHQQDYADPYELVSAELSTVCDNIKQALRTGDGELENIAGYHFDGKGKSFRPMIVMLMAKACNKHMNTNEGKLLVSQQRVAEIAEMIHTASLVHDDVIDGADTRRGKPSVQQSWGQRKAILTGDYILAISSMLLARIRNEEVVEVLATVLEDLVRGEFMQLGSKENENERFAHYLRKTFKKTASLVANSCKAVSILSECPDDLVEVAYQYGRNVGMAFQLVDDVLDFISTEALMGKPAAADLKLGLATAPVLFAAQEFPELNPMIMRRFSHKGDVETAWKLVEKSDGIAQTRFLAEQHCEESVRLISQLDKSQEQHALITVTHKVLNRLK